MVYIFLADGFEEMEAIVPYDLLKRNGNHVKTVGIGKKTITGSHGLNVVADITESELNLNDIEAIVLPGGMPGATNLSNSDTIIKAVNYAKDNNKLICAICAAPGVVLSKLGVLDNHKYTCYPGFETEKGIYTKGDVETDQYLITANGPQSSYKFGTAICSLLNNKKG